METECLLNEIEGSIKSLARTLLVDQQVEKIIGYKKGSLPGRVVPIVIDNPDQVDQLVWNSFCDSNLARYVKRELKETKGKIGIVAKGCTGRALVQLMVEKQIPRDRIYIIGLNCAGTIDRRKIADEIGSDEILEMDENNGKIRVKGRNFEREFEREDYLNFLCQVCKYPIPPVYDEILGDNTPKVPTNENYEDVLEFEAKTSGEKWAYFRNALKNCTRCYACREACPMCYCGECFCDQTQPAWFSKAAESSEIVVFHLVRAMHLAGRCVACGDCNVVCPMGVDLIPITRKLEKIVKDRFGGDVGLDQSRVPPMSDFKMEDSEEFFEEEE